MRIAAADTAAVQGLSGRGEGAFGYSRPGPASQPGAPATGAGGPGDLDLWRKRGAETGGNPEAMRCGLGVCSQSLAIMGGGGAAAGERSSSEGRAADSVVWAAPAPEAGLSLRLRRISIEKPSVENGQAACAEPASGGQERVDWLGISMRLRGGGDDAEEGSQGLGYEDEEAGAATQAFGDDDDEDNAVLTRLHDGQAAGVAATLPDGVLCDILTIGRDEQAATREGGTISVRSLQLDDGRPHGQKIVSGLQAEVVCGQGGMTLISKGQGFSFVNDMPLHAEGGSPPCRSSTTTFFASAATWTASREAVHRTLCTAWKLQLSRLHARTLPPSTKSYVVVPFLNTPCTWVLRLQTIPISLS